MERPASVVKELIENSLDSGSTQIEVEIEKGGHKRICIRDNGSGIPKSELQLALSRHATSKISHLDDLERIVSLGFRGEALASISSVSRLNLTSKPSDQAAAWQACAQGRDMEVLVQPAAHPNGTSVEVLDLFFNTPARRKFLRTEKTEFQHIDEVVRRIALSRTDVAFVLKHNGKIVRKCVALSQDKSAIERVAQWCSPHFAENAVEVQSQYQDMQLSGWILSPAEVNSVTDLQYFYVNGRMMRDKLIQHAVRQAYEGLIDPQFAPAFVLYLTVNPADVDVNVHPAKHEVRFHQSRLVHDFIFRALNEALSQLYSECQQSVSVQEPSPVNHDYIRTLARVETGHEGLHNYTHAPEQHSSPRSNVGSSTPVRTAVDPRAAKHYQALMQPHQVGHESKVQVIKVSADWVLILVDSQIYKSRLINLLQAKLEEDWTAAQRVSQPLLMPISIALGNTSQSRFNVLHESASQLGIDIALGQRKLMVKQVPAGTRALNWADTINHWLTELEQQQTQAHDGKSELNWETRRLLWHCAQSLGMNSTLLAQQWQSLSQWAEVQLTSNSSAKSWLEPIDLVSWLEMGN